MAKYRPLSRNANIDSESALIQAAASLDAAAVVAETLRDVEGLLNVAAMWMKYGEALTNFVEYQAEVEANEQEFIKQRPKLDTGFQRAVPVEPDITVEEEEEND